MCKVEGLSFNVDGPPVQMRADVATAIRMGPTMSPTRLLPMAKILEISTLILMATTALRSMTIWRINRKAMGTSLALIAAIPTRIWTCLGVIPSGLSCLASC
jgi:hypothetical protein